MIRKITLLAVTAMCLMAADATAQGSRLVGRHTMWFDNGWTPTDTAVYSYAATNHGGEVFEISNQRLNYDTSYNVAWNGSAYQYYRKYVKTFNVQGKCTQRLELQINGTTETNDRRAVFTLDANGNVLEELNQDWVSNAWVNTSRITSTYDANNNQLTQIVDYWGGTSWGSSYLSVFTYDGDDNMTSYVSATQDMQTMLYDSTHRSEQFYNGDNLVDSTRSYTWNGGWQLTSRSINHYDINNVYLGWSAHNWDNTNSAWVNSYQGFMLFDVNNVRIGDSSQVWDATNNTWVNQSRGRRVLDGNNLTIASLYEMWNTTTNAFVDDFRDSMEYNGFDQLVWDKRESWDATTQSWGKYADKENDYYYESYTADVKTMVQSAGSLIVYPSPARYNITIAMQWNKAQDFVVGIYDIQGRLVRQWGEKATTDYKKDVPLSGLSAGTYILKIRGKDATVQEQFVIMD